jgi:hypothetical protein
LYVVVDYVYGVPVEAKNVGLFDYYDLFPILN